MYVVERGRADKKKKHLAHVWLGDGKFVTIISK